MPRTKIVLIGAGSTEFTPGLLADLVSSPTLRDSEVALVDIDPWAVDTMVGLARRPQHRARRRPRDLGHHRSSRSDAGR